jgi:hypothetical protein
MQLNLYGFYLDTLKPDFLLFLFFLFFVELDAERLEKLEILIADLEFGIGAERACGNQGSVVGAVFSLFADADGGFEDEEDVVAAFFDSGDDLGDRFGVGERFVNGFSKFFHELLQLLVHAPP